MEKEKIDIDNIALLLHNKGEYSGFQCWELEHIYMGFIKMRIQEFYRDFIFLIDGLMEKGNKIKDTDRKKFSYLSEWTIHQIEKKPIFNNPYPSYEQYNYLLRASRSSMNVQYEVIINWLENQFYIKCWEYKSSGQNLYDWILIETFKIPERPLFEITLDKYKQLALFSNWFYRLFDDAKYEKLI